jgi:hypothetical protein
MDQKKNKRVKIVKTALLEPKKREFAYYYIPLWNSEAAFQEKDRHDGAM